MLTRLATYNSLGRILEKLMEHPEVQASPYLLDRIDNALKFHKGMVDELAPHTARYEQMDERFAEMAEEIAALKFDPSVRIPGETFRRVIEKYRLLRDSGGNAELIYRVAKAERVEEIVRLNILQMLFDLSLEEAEAIARSINEEQNVDNP
jgi:hypothetical protein